MPLSGAAKTSSVLILLVSVLVLAIISVSPVSGDTTTCGTYIYTTTGAGGIPVTGLGTVTKTYTSTISMNDTHVTGAN